MNGYDLHRMRLNFRFDNPDKCRSIHSELFMYICDLWNRLGQKDKFGLPTSVTMELLDIGSYNTYNKAYQDLLSRGFIKEIRKSENQYCSRIIALSKIDKATDKSLDKSTIKSSDKSSDKSTDIIDKQYNKEQINNKQDLFDEFWNLYPNKQGKEKARKKYIYKDHDIIMVGLKNYIASLEAQKTLTGFDQRYKNGDTWVGNRCWLDYQDSQAIEELNFEAVYQEYTKDYENNFAENWKKKYGVSHEPNSLFMRCKKRVKDEGLFR